MKRTEYYPAKKTKIPRAALPLEDPPLAFVPPVLDASMSSEKNRWDSTKMQWVPVDKFNPQHYRDHPSGVECIQIAEHMTFNVGQVFKYLWRAGKKGPLLDDLKKAQWYIDREIKRVSKP